MTESVLTLETNRLILRRPNPGDWPAFRDFMMSKRSSGVGGPHPEGKSWRAFASELGHWEIHGFGMWSVTLKGDDNCSGMIGPWCPADWPENEIGWMIFADKLEGAGLAFEAARAAVNHAYHSLGWHTVVSYIDDGNKRSIALAERLGAVLDPDAPQPKPDTPCLVYRHPNPEVTA